MAHESQTPGRGKARTGLPEGHRLLHLSSRELALLQVPGGLLQAFGEYLYSEWKASFCSYILVSLYDTYSSTGPLLAPRQGVWGTQRLCQLGRRPLEVLALNSSFDICKMVSAASCAVCPTGLGAGWGGQVLSKLLFFFIFVKHLASVLWQFQR